MASTADAAVVDHIVVMQRLKQSFRAIERDAACLRFAMWFCGAGLLLACLMLAHHLFQVPALSFLWTLIVSICS
jgi:hypothetical protein